MQDDPPQNHRAGIAIAIAAFVSILSAGVVCSLVLVGRFPWEALSKVVSTFMALDPIISILGFAGVLYALLLQISQSRMQRLEISMQRKELELATEANRKSIELAVQQASIAAIQIKLTVLQTRLDINVAESANGGAQDRLLEERNRLVDEIKSVLYDLNRLLEMK